MSRTVFAVVMLALSTTLLQQASAFQVGVRPGNLGPTSAVTHYDGYRRRPYVAAPLYFFDKLSESISEISSSLRGRKRLTESSLEGALRDVKKALVEADVNVKVVNDLVQSVKTNALGTEAAQGIEPAQQFVKLMYDQLVAVMGGDADDADARAKLFEERSSKTASPATTRRPFKVLLLCGLQGAGKTTAAAKLARYLKEEEGRTPVLVAADTFRPAAAEQLQILGDKIGVRVYREAVTNETEAPADAVALVRRALTTVNATEENRGEDCVIVDTAGRQAIEESLMTELKKISDVTRPDETLLVLDAMTGQEAANVCARFDATTKLTGAVLTKLDGDARGGAALSIKAVSGVPVKFVGVGETVNDLDPFYPARMASRILGMGDVVTLVEKASREISVDEAERQMKRVKAGEFDFEDYLQQSEAVRKMGSFSAVAKMLPGGMGAGLDPKRIAEAEIKAELHSALISAMTPDERRTPDLFVRDKGALARLRRIASDSGHTYEEAQKFIQDFQSMRTMMQRMAAQSSQGGGNLENNAASSSSLTSSSPDAADMAGMVGNRAARRAAKKKGKNKAGANKGFGR